MRNIKNLSLVTVLTLLLAMPVMAQDYNNEMDFTVGVKAGWTFFQDDPMSSVVESNWLIGGDAILWFQEYYGIGADVKWSYKENDDVAWNDIDMMIEHTQIPINVNAYYRFPFEQDNEKAKFYAGAGASFIFVDTKVDYIMNNTSLDYSNDDTVIGLNGLLGFQWDMFFVEGQYTYATWDDEGLMNLLNESDEINIGGFNISAGVRF